MGHLVAIDVAAGAAFPARARPLALRLVLVGLSLVALGGAFGLAPAAEIQVAGAALALAGVVAILLHGLLRGEAEIAAEGYPASGHGLESSRAR